jgi:hypothetical protein
VQAQAPPPPLPVIIGGRQLCIVYCVIELFGDAWG